MRQGVLRSFIVLTILFFPFGLSAQNILEEGISQYRAENFEEALELFKKAEEIQPSTILYFYLGLTYKQMGEFNMARKYFELAISGRPKIFDAYPEIIEILYVLDRIDEAKLWLSEAKKQGLFPGKISFLEGLILVKENAYNEARKAFERAKSADESMAQVCDLQIALTYAAEKKFKEAQDTFKALIKIDPKTEVADFARDYLSALEKVSALYKRWSVNLTAGFLYDDNVVLKPDANTGIPAVDEITRRADKAVVANLKMEFRSNPGEKLFFNGDLTLGTKDYFRMNTHDTLTGSLKLNPGYNIHNGTFITPFEASYMLLNGRRYMSIFSIRPTYIFRLSGFHVGQISAGFAKREMFSYLKDLDPAEDRDAKIYNVLVGYYYSFKGGKGLLWAKYEYQVDNSEGRNWRSHTQKISSGIIYPLSEGISLSLSGDFSTDRFDRTHTLSGRGINGFPSDPEKRKDIMYNFAVGGIFEITKSLKLNLNYNRFRSDSNFVIYDYKRNLISAELVYSF